MNAIPSTSKHNISLDGGVLMVSWLRYWTAES